MYITDTDLKNARWYENMGDHANAQRHLEWYLENMARLKPGDKLIFGEYNMVGSMKPSPAEVRAPLTWLVLHREGSRLLLLSEHCLDWDCFDGSGPFLGPAPVTTWEYSTLRRYLNSEFYEDAFGNYQMAMICPTTVQTGSNYCTGTKGGRTTEDMLFLLSIEEVLRYLCRDTGPAEKSREDRYFIEKRIPADIDYSGAAAGQILANSSYKTEGLIDLCWYASPWWLRTPGAEQTRVACVLPSGRIYPEGYTSDSDEIGIRPAMWIDLDRIDLDLV